MELVDGHHAFLPGTIDLGPQFNCVEHEELHASPGDSLSQLGELKTRSSNAVALQLTVRSSLLRILIPKRTVPWHRDS
jgi:hypothetical protein